MDALNLDELPDDIVEAIEPGSVPFDETQNPFFQDSDFLDSVSGAMPVYVGLFLLAFLAMVGVIIWIWVRNYRASKAAGYDFFTLQTDVATRVASSQVLTPAKPLEQRLAELEDLYSHGIISRDEYTQARVQILTE